MQHGVMAFTAVFLKSKHGYVGFIEELPHVNAHGSTIEEARRTLQELIGRFRGVKGEGTGRKTLAVA